MRIALAPHGMRHSQPPAARSASRRWTTAIVAALVLHLWGLVIASHWPQPVSSPPLDPPALKVELVRLPAARPRPAPVIHQIARPRPKHVVPPPRPPVTRTADPPRRIHLTMPKTQFHHGIIAAPQITRATIADAPRAPAAAQQPLTAPPLTTMAAPAPAAAAPAQAAPVASALPAVPVNSNAVANWQGLLLARLAKFRQYPPAARARNQQGVAYVRFSVDRHGHVLSASIDTSSGNDLLDAEALAVMHRAEPLPPTPTEMPDPAELVIPIQFSLKPGAF